MNAKEQRRQEWASRIEDYRSSGLTMAAWCEANGFTIDNLKYWLYKRPKSSETSSRTTHFVPVAVTNSSDDLPSTSSLVVRIGHASIEVQNGFDPALLRQVIQALESTC